MKKYLAVLSVLAVALLSGGSAWAFTSKKVQSVTANAAVGGTPDANFVLNIRNVSTPEGSDATQLTWPGIAAGAGWTMSAQLIRLTWIVTDAVGGGIQIYTDNKGAGASPSFVDPTPADTTNLDSNPAGLLRGTSGTTNETVAMAWSIKDSTITIKPIAAADPNSGPTNGSGNKFQWLFMLDKNTPAIDRNGNGVTTDAGVDTAAFLNGGTFSTVAKTAGIHFGQADSEFGADSDHLSYIYLEADFSTAGAGLSYQTNKLTLEAFVQ